jgi:piezo-type mechanosensitive ion channel component 1/2
MPLREALVCSPMASVLCSVIYICIACSAAATCSFLVYQPTAGLTSAVHGMDLVVLLLRPIAILFMLGACRWLQSLGAAHRALLEAQRSPEETERLRLREQYTLVGFLKRFTILNSGKAVALLGFAAAMQAHGGIGLVLVLGLALIPPFLRPLQPHPGGRRQLMDLALDGAKILTLLWLLAQYTVEVAGVREAILSDPGKVDLVRWMGLSVLEEPDAASLERVLRLKWILLLVVFLRRHSELWQGEMPLGVRAAARNGAACPMFWPPSMGTPVPEEEELASPRPGAGLAPSLQSALAELVARITLGLRQLLVAVDWQPAEELAQQQGGTAVAPSRSGSFGPRRLSRLVVARFVAQDWLERSWDDLGLDLSLFALLIAAFLSANALSLVHVALIGTCMVLGRRKRRAVWRAAVVPWLAFALSLEYSVLVGLPPAGADLLASGRPIDGAGKAMLGAMSDDVRDWLGVGLVAKHALWGLYVALSLAVLQLRFDAWRQDPGAHEEQEGGSRSGALFEPSSSAAPRIWQPMDYGARASWRYHDWARYYLYRHSLDIVLVSVVAMCGLEVDIIHAGYLAIALYFFRGRIRLRAARNRLFFWLPLYNFAVLFVCLAYNAPIEDIWNWSLDDTTSCTLAHLLGLYKLGSRDPAARILSWGGKGVLADLVLWAVVRAQTRMYATETYTKVVRVVEAEERTEQRALREELAAEKDAAARAAVEAARRRGQRQVRIARLKEGLSRLGSRFGESVGPGELDFSFLDDVHGGTSKVPSSEPSSSDVASGPHLTEYEEEVAKAAEQPGESISASRQGSEAWSR